MKFLSFLKKTTFTLVCLFVFLIIGCYLCVYSYSRFEHEEQVLCLKNYFATSENIYTDVTPNEETTLKITEFISSLSPNISSVFLKDWKIIISPNAPRALNLSTDEIQHPSTESENTTEIISILGYSDWHLRLIFIKAQPDPVTMFHVFVHELGHCFDYEFGTPSSTDKFKQIYALYKDTFIEIDNTNTSVNHINSTEEEFFATVFKEYFLSPEHLKINAPQAYEFFDALYAQVSANPAASSTVTYDLQSAFLILKKKTSN